MFTAEGVARVCRQAKKAEADRGGCSIATSEHAHSREVQRRLRQAERRKERHTMSRQNALLERVARALSIPQHHTGWRYLSAADKDLFYLQADYALKELENELNPPRHK